MPLKISDTLTVVMIFYLFIFTSHRLIMEYKRITTKTLLEMKGHLIKPSRTMGSVQAIISKDNYFYGAADPRRPSSGAVSVSLNP